MPSPTQIRLDLTPASRYDVTDVNRRIAEEFGDVAVGYRKAFYTSYHTTAGYLEPGLSRRLRDRKENLDQFIEGFQALFPPDADYTHDRMELREELSSEQKQVEPKNADAHLAFMGAGMRSSVAVRSRPDRPMYFIDLDGVNGDRPRTRSTSVLFHDREELVAFEPLEIPVSKHPIDSINLADPRLGLMERLDEMIRTHGVENGRVEIRLHSGESQSALTVNEYETLLMKHDLPEVLRNPLKYAAEKGYNMLRDPLSVPGKAKDYAKFDFVLVFNQLLERLGVSDSLIERILAGFLAFPADRFFRMKRHISFLASADPASGRPGIVRGTYQSPILVQWGAAPGGVRHLVVRVTRFQ